VKTTETSNTQPNKSKLKKRKPFFSENPQ